MATVYALEFSNGKFYVGSTIQNIKERWWNHVQYSRYPAPRAALYEAWNLLGEPKLKILLICSNNLAEYYEGRAVKTYNSYLDGYNSTQDGRAGGQSPQYAEATKQRMAGNTLRSGIPHSEVTKSKMVATHRELANSPERRAHLKRIAQEAWARRKALK